MLIIRKEQIDVFQQYAERNFIESVVMQLRTNNKEAVKDMADEQLFKRVAYGIERAKEYEFTWKKDLSAFVTLMFEIGIHFDSYPVFQKYLTDESIPPNERMGTLLRETTEIDWQGAQEDPTQTEWLEDWV